MEGSLGDVADKLLTALADLWDRTLLKKPNALGRQLLSTAPIGLLAS